MTPSVPAPSLALAAGPQPLGILPPPAGFLLLPESASPLAAPGLARLLAGDLSGPLPAEWEFYRRAAAGDPAEALAVLELPNHPIAAYDRFVLSGDLSAFARLPALFSGDLGRLIACVAFAAGESDCLPDAERAEATTVAAVAWMVRAAAEIEAGEPGKALASLDRGIAAVRADSPNFAAQLLAQKAALLADPATNPESPEGDRKAALAALRQAVALVPPGPDGGCSPIRASLYLAFGQRLQDAAAGDRSGLLEAVQAYQAAIHSGLSLDHDEESYALAQNNLGLAYLAMPMSGAGSALRLGIAVQSFREALKVWTPEAHPEAWSSAQLNLANALQYLPSSHPEENLVQAVEIYERLLAHRNRAYDPLGYARLLANQANALAHLGIFAPALAKIEEAHKLFHWHGEPDLAASALAQVERINERLDARGGPPASGNPPVGLAEPAAFEASGVEGG